MTDLRPIPDPGRLSPPPGINRLFNPAELDDRATGDALVDALSAARESLDASLFHQFDEGEHVSALLKARAWAVEQMVLCAWRSCARGVNDLALLAVGGFGRGVLHPHSDVDLMVLFEAGELDPDQKQAVEAFVTVLWDAGFYLGHSVRNLDQCDTESRADVATATSLIESRRLSGREDLVVRLHEQLSAGQLWPARAFFYAKLAEQRTRHQQFHETAYNLEPNIKEGPGGLRDIQMVGWVTQRHFGGRDLHGLVDHGFLSEAEFSELTAGQRFLWTVRFALHRQAGRAEDRLLFEHQRPIALQLGYGGAGEGNAPVEAFMQDYYRTISALERLNERLLQLFEEELLADGERQVEPLGEDFRLINGYLGLVDDGLFQRRPEALIEMFLILARHADIRGVRASAVREVVNHLHLVDDRFRRDPAVLGLFTELMSQGQGVYTQLQRMNRYGLLAALLPVFGNVVGRMQFDLFHAYTVDQHTLFVIRNLRRFAYGKYQDTFPNTKTVFRDIERPVVLYLAALFHDIAKGRGGDHSELGARDARDFCSRLPLEDGEVDLIEWLVANHLLMSQTAQKRDINDPEVIEAFAARVDSIPRLQHLYLLTVADISATSPNLWNGWKSGLLWELYRATHRSLSRDHRAPTRDEWAEAQRQALAQGAAAADVEAERWAATVAALPDSVFSRFSPEQLSWAVTERCRAAPEDTVVEVRQVAQRAVSEVLVSAPDYTGLFATTTVTFDELGINVLSARVITTADGLSFDLFHVMDRHGRPLNDSDRERLREQLVQRLDQRTVTAPLERVLPRRLRPFVTAPRVSFGTARGGSVTTMQLECTDRPGLISQVATALVGCNVRIHDAMIATLGDRVEDTFMVSDRDGSPLDQDRREQLEAAVLQLFLDP